MVKVKKKIVTKKPLKRLSCGDRREKIKEHINDVGYWNINNVELGKKYSVTSEQIRQDLMHIKKNYDFDIEGTAVNWNYQYKKAVKELRSIITDTEHDNTRISAINSLANLEDKHTKMLERFGKKEPIAEKHELSGSVETVTAGDIKALYDEVQASKKKR